MKRILIFRNGSVGDTVVALPCFHLLAKVFPDAERCLLTASPTDERAVSPSALFAGSALIHRCLTYHSSELDLPTLFRLRDSIRTWGPDILVYLAEPQNRFTVFRDSLFFRSCGIQEMAGLPRTRELRTCRWMTERRIYEHECERLLRCLEVFGEMPLDDPRSWGLGLTAEEDFRISEILDRWPARDRFLACSVTAKIGKKEWGPENWKNLFSRLSSLYPNLGLVIVGARIDREPGQAISGAWKGPVLNLCGELSIRECAALMKRPLFFLGHDSGAMHLAAAAGIPCVAVFVECQKPGVWFPYGRGHRVIYRETHEENPRPITVDEVLLETGEMIGERLHARI